MLLCKSENLDTRKPDRFSRRWSLSGLRTRRLTQFISTVQNTASIWTLCC